MKLLVTGATGFVGRAVVAAAAEAGHDVRAVVRPATGPGPLQPLLASARVELARIDLRSRRGLGEAVTGVDSVIHLAAAKAGDFTTQFAGTVVATENLLWAMADTGVDQLVGVSTFSVYDYGAIRPGEVVTESSPIDHDPVRRDEYARTKLVQEELYHHFGTDRRVVVLRPGMIYGPDNLWHALLGAELGPRFLRIGSKAILPLTYVENCAEAMVLAAEGLAADPSPVAGQVINLVDDDLPTQGRYVEAVSTAIDPPPTVTVPWPIMRAVATGLAAVNDAAFDGRAKFPGIVVPDRLDARFKPLRYSNDKAKRLLGWQPRYDLETAIARSGVEPR